MYPEKFDISKLSENDKDILKQFFDRRQLFDNFLLGENMKLFTCPGCGYPTLHERGGYEICSVCNWEDDHQDNERADEVWGGPNGDLSLSENRINIGRTLHLLAKERGGRINSNPKEVLLILQSNDKRMDEIRNSIPLDAHITHEGWANWKNAEKDILKELITTEE